ncbi:MAG: hypothetical protein PHX70_06225, partial [Clostridium sp.]|nr:hypothetical protein [Clostridium sp.]
MKQLVIFIFLGIILLIGYRQSGMSSFFRNLLLILAAKDIPYKRILHTCRIAISSTFFISICLFVLGVSNSGVIRRGYAALGYEHPNVAAQVMTTIGLLWLAEIGTKVTIKHYIKIELLSIIIFFLTGSRTAVILLACIPFVIEITKHLMKK